MNKKQAVQVSSNLANHPRLKDILSAPVQPMPCKWCNEPVHKVNSQGVCNECIEEVMHLAYLRVS